LSNCTINSGYGKYSLTLILRLTLHPSIVDLLYFFCWKACDFNVQRFTLGTDHSAMRLSFFSHCLFIVTPRHVPEQAID